MLRSYSRPLKSKSVGGGTKMYIFLQLRVHSNAQVGLGNYSFKELFFHCQSWRIICVCVCVVWGLKAPSLANSLCTAFLVTCICWKGTSCNHLAISRKGLARHAVLAGGSVLQGWLWLEAHSANAAVDQGFLTMFSLSLPSAACSAVKNERAYGHPSEYSWHSDQVPKDRVTYHEVLKQMRPSWPPKNGGQSCFSTQKCKEVGWVVKGLMTNMPLN